MGNERKSAARAERKSLLGCSCIGLTIALAVLFGLAATVFLFLGSPVLIPGVTGTPYTTLKIVEEFVEDADEEYLAGDYSAAAAQYARALSKLRGLADYETKSPKSDEELIFQYYVLDTVIQAKFSATQIGLRVKAIEVPEP